MDFKPLTESGVDEERKKDVKGPGNAKLPIAECFKTFPAHCETTFNRLVPKN